MEERIVFVIGNGESRRHYDLKNIYCYGNIFGCNALIRDFIPDFLVATDNSMIKEIKENYNGDYNFIWRQNGSLHSNFGIKYIDDGYSSGPTALRLACQLIKPDRIYMLGFDMRGVDGLINNIYKGTDNYLNENNKPIDTTQWIKEIEQICDNHPKIKFIKVDDNASHKIKSNNLYTNTYFEMDYYLSNLSLLKDRKKHWNILI